MSISAAMLCFNLDTPCERLMVEVFFRAKRVTINAQFWMAISCFKYKEGHFSVKTNCDEDALSNGETPPGTSPSVLVRSLHEFKPPNFV